MASTQPDSGLRLGPHGIWGLPTPLQVLQRQPVPYLVRSRRGQVSPYPDMLWGL